MDFLQEADFWVDIQEASKRCHISSATMRRYLKNIKNSDESRKYIKAFSSRYILYHWKNLEEYILDFNDRRRKN